MADFDISIHEINQTTILKLEGFLDAHTAPKLENTLNDLISLKKVKLVADFEKLNYISSAGLGVFMAFIETVRSESGDIKFCNVQPKVYEVFELLGFPMIYEFYETQAQAVDKF